MRKRVLIEGIIEVTKQPNFSKIEVRQGNEDYRLEEIVIKALGDELPEKYGQKYAGKVFVEIELNNNSIEASVGQQFDSNTRYEKLDMGEEQ